MTTSSTKTLRGEFVKTLHGEASERVALQTLEPRIGHSGEELVDLIEKLTGKRIPVDIVAPSNPPVSNGLDDLAGVYDVSAAKRDLQFTAEYDLASGFAKTLEMEAR